MDKFWAKVQYTPGCWLWGGTVEKSGYGRYGNYLRGPTMAHRIAYELLVGPIPIGLELDHLCRVRHCVNPAHLEAVTHAENVRRSVARCAKKTHCPTGHEYDYITSQGKRSCVTCLGETQKRYRDKRRALLHQPE